MNKASFQYGLSSNFPGISSKLTKLGQSLSIACLKKGLLERGWLVIEPGFDVLWVWLGLDEAVRWEEVVAFYTC